MDGSYEATKRNTTISYFTGALHLQAVLDGANDPEETINDKETFRAFWPFDSNVLKLKIL